MAALTLTIIIALLFCWHWILKLWSLPNL